MHFSTGATIRFFRKADNGGGAEFLQDELGPDVRRAPPKRLLGGTLLPSVSTGLRTHDDTPQPND